MICPLCRRHDEDHIITWPRPAFCMYPKHNMWSWLTMAAGVGYFAAHLVVWALNGFHMGPR